MPNAKALYQQETFSNGLSVVLRPMAHVESVAVGVWVRAGGRYERLSQGGVSHFVEHLLFKGTRTRSCEQLKQAIEGVGGGFNGFTAEEFTCYMAKVPARYQIRAINALADMVLHPTMQLADVEKEREVILEEIRMAEDAPGQYVHELFNQLLWPNHPLGSLLAGTLESVKGLTRQDIVAYWRRMYHPRNVLVACAGAFESERVLRQLRSVFRRASTGRPQRAVPAPRPLKGPQVKILHKDTEQTHVCVGTPALSRMHPLRFAVELLHVILGANMSSRLFREVREKRALVYEIGTHVKRYRDTGAFVIYAGCDAAKLDTTLRIVMAELARIKREPVPARELQRAKEFYRGQLLMSLEDTMEQMLWMGEQATTVGRVARPQDLLEALDRVTPKHIRRAAQLLFTSPRLFLAVVGPIPTSETSRLRSACEVR